MDVNPLSEKEEAKLWMGKLAVPAITSVLSLGGALMLYPFDSMINLIKAKRSDDMAMTIRKTVRKEGFRYFFRGFDTAVFETVPPTLVYFMLYDSFNAYFSQQLDQGKRWVPTISSFLSEALSMLMIVPVETVRLRIQSGKAKFDYKSTFEGLSRVLRSEGLFSLYHSSIFYVSTMILYVTIQFSIYEWWRAASKDQHGACSFANTCWGTVVGTCAAVLVTNPSDNFLVHSLTTNFYEKKYKEVTKWQLFKDRVHADGLRGYVRGVVPRALSHSLHFLLVLPPYELLKSHWGLPEYF